VARDAFLASCADELADIQRTLHTEARERLDGNIDRSLTSREALEAFFGAGATPGWAEVPWSRPEGAALDEVVEWLKRHKLTLRNVPLDAPPPDGLCVFTGEPAVERVLVSRAY
jgi:prolyl-tRNA synthetase